MMSRSRGEKSQFLNSKRIRDYPRLMLVAISAILAANLLLHNGWISGLGQVIGGDFVVFYATGQLYKTNPTRIYDYAEQYDLQRNLVEPSTLGGLNPYINPPYVAMLCSVLTILPLPWSLLLWSILSLTFCFLSVHLMSPLIPNKLRISGLTNKQTLILILSFFPFTEGLIAGQNHSLTLLLVTAIMISAYTKRWLLCGMLAGAMVYKPHLVIGLLIVWVVWKNYKALLGFTVVFILWVGSFSLVNGISPFIEYFQISQFFMSLPYIEGFPGYIIITLYGLLISIFPLTSVNVIQVISQVFFILTAGVLAWLAYRQKKCPSPQQLPLLALAIVFPLAFSPYVQLHDLLIVVPIFVVWAMFDNRRRVFITAVLTYAGAFLLTFLATLTGIAWMAFITLGLGAQIFLWNFSLLKPQVQV